jgi:hypothetical protein
VASYTYQGKPNLSHSSLALSDRNGKGGLLAAILIYLEIETSMSVSYLVLQTLLAIDAITKDVKVICKHNTGDSECESNTHFKFVS